MEEMLKKELLYNTLYVVFRRKVRLTLLCGLSFGLVVLFALLTTPTFKATTKILVRSNPQQQLILFKDLASPGREPPMVNPARNLIQILTGREMAQKVVERFKLDERIRAQEKEAEEYSLSKAINSIIGVARELVGVEKVPKNYFAEAVERLMEQAEDIQLEEDSNVINLSIWEETPGLSSDIANYMAQLLIERSAQLEQDDAKQASDFTGEQVKAAESALTNSEAEIVRFREKNGIVSLEEQKKAKLDELHAVEAQHIAVKVESAEEKAKLEELRGRISAQKKLLSESPIFANDSVIKELVRSLNRGEIQLAGELEEFTESNRSVISLRAKISENRDRIEKEIRAIRRSDTAVLASIHPDLPKEYAQMTANVAALVARKNSLEKEMDALKAEAFSLSVLETELERLNRHRETEERLYMNLLDKFSQLEVQKAFQMSGYDLKIIDKANVPEGARPDRPNWPFLIPLGFAGSFLLSCGIVFFIEYWDESFKSPRDVEQKLELDVLCTVPDVG